MTTKLLPLHWLLIGLASACAIAGCGDDDDGDDGPSADAGPDGGGSGSGGAGRAGSGGGGAGGGGAGGGGAGDGGEEPDCIKRGPITEDTTWEPVEECPDGFDVLSTVEVRNSGTTLTIEPGTTLRFDSDADLVVAAGAALVAIGSEDEPIVFTGWQELAGSWGGIIIRSNAVANEISHAVVEYAGAESGPSGAIALARETATGEQPGRLVLTSTVIRDNAKFGLTLLRSAVLSEFEDNTISDNAEGAIRVEAPALPHLAGTGNTIEDNGDDNIVQVETSILMPIEDDVSWPNLAPAPYRVTGPNGEGGALLYIKNHVTIEAGAVFEMAGGSGFEVLDGTAGLSAIGTEEDPIVFKGIDDSSWQGIGFCETSWTGNALEYVEVRNALGPAPAWGLCGTGATDVRDAGILVGHNFADKPSLLRVANLTVAGPNNSAADIAIKTPESMLVQEGTNTGTGAGDALELEEF